MRIHSFLLLSASTIAIVSASNCWKDAYGRGVGRAIHSCEQGWEQNGALCYPLCRDNFGGVGPVCWENCPSRYTDTGADCLKPSAYGRGAGYTSEHSCVNDNKDKPKGCEEWGLLWYPKCDDGFHYFGCCVCSPDCPSDMPDIGVSCQKNSYGRGVGKPLGCASDEEMSGLLCYPPCRNGYSGNGPVCWENCPSGKHECGALCTDTADTCTDNVKDIVSNVVGIAVDVAIAAITGSPINMLDIIKKAG